MSVNNEISHILILKFQRTLYVMFHSLSFQVLASILCETKKKKNKVLTAFKSRDGVMCIRSLGTLYTFFLRECLVVLLFAIAFIIWIDD